MERRGGAKSDRVRKREMDGDEGDRERRRGNDEEEGKGVRDD